MVHRCGQRKALGFFRIADLGHLYGAVGVLTVAVFRAGPLVVFAGSVPALEDPAVAVAGGSVFALAVDPCPAGLP